tara:strand:+ start:815 stop:1336 length:522 start_codon:yes stop_codon:yes gene_type:complete
MREISELIREILPPADYQHRNGFTNNSIILSLSEEEKLQIEQKLISFLKFSDDTLIGETLAFMKSIDALPALREKLSQTSKPVLRILWSSYINQIKEGDQEMKDIAFEEFKRVRGKYSLIPLFWTLRSFCDDRINERIRKYINHRDYLVSYNAKVALGIPTNSIPSKKWWQFW